MQYTKPEAVSTRQVVATDAAGLTTWVNKAFTASTGYTLQDLLGHTPGSVLQGPGTSLEARGLLSSAVRENRECHGVELLNYRKDGSSFMARIDMEPQFDAARCLTGFIALQTDISGQQQEREQIALMQRWVQAVRRDPAVGLFERNYDANTVFWDDGMLAIWGRRAGTAGLSMDDYRASIVAEDLPLILRTRREAQEEPGFHEAEYRIHRSDGEIRWVQSYWAVERNDRGQRVAIGSVRDITVARRQREDAATERQQLLMAAELAQVGLIREDLPTGRVRANAAARRLFGVPSSGSLNHAQLHAGIHPEDTDEVHSAWQDLIGGGTAPTGVRYRVQQADGQITHVLSTRRQLQDSHGLPTEVIGVVVDITPQVSAVQAEARARQMAAERDQASALATSRLSLLAAVSHEVRTPLSAMVVACEQLAQLEATQSPSCRTWLDVLQETSTHLRGLADDLLSGMTPNATETVEPAQAVELDRKVGRAIQLLQGTAVAAGVTLEADASLRAWVVMAAERRLRQVLLNLLGNAIKYNRRGGWVRCSARAAGDGAVELRIEDNGVGMTPAQLKRLFRPFDRLGRESGGVPGIGLGMFLARRFVADMGGDIRVESTAEQGTCVSVWLPLPSSPEYEVERSSVHPPSPAPVPVPVPEHTAEPAVVAGMSRLLCVDDDPLAPTLLQAQLAGTERYELTFADSIVTALAALATMRDHDRMPHLALLDGHLGNHGGAELLQALRDAGYSGMAVAYTGDTDPAAHIALLAAGFSEVWLKPMTAEKLRLALPRVLGAMADSTRA
jgi:PAS domain S-box-containing protein